MVPLYDHCESCRKQRVSYLVYVDDMPFIVCLDCMVIPDER